MRRLLFTKGFQTKFTLIPIFKIYAQIYM